MKKKGVKKKKSKNKEIIFDKENLILEIHLKKEIDKEKDREIPKWVANMY